MNDTTINKVTATLDADKNEERTDAYPSYYSTWPLESSSSTFRLLIEGELLL
jgi:hypothetical protein